MTVRKNTLVLLEEYINTYPKSKIEDIFKFLHQSAFGCEHLVSSFDVALSRIESEKASLLLNTSPFVEKLDGDYSRVSLHYLMNGLKSETLARLFLLSSLEPKDNAASLEERLNVAQDMIKEGVLPFSLDEFEKKRCEWAKKGHPALHHSDEFRNEYHPAYRVISNKYVTFLPLFAMIDQKTTEKRTLVAIEGGSACGKSTLGEVMRSVYNCTVFHMDDYFLPPEKRTKERFDEVGGNVDYERFNAEVLTPLKNGEETITYRKFDCSTMSLLPPTTERVAPLVIIEGAYSMHPTLSDKYDISSFLDITPEKQRARIEKRNSPAFAKRFFEEWIPLEMKYFNSLSIKEKCDIVIEV